LTAGDSINDHNDQHLFSSLLLLVRNFPGFNRPSTKCLQNQETKNVTKYSVGNVFDPEKKNLRLDLGTFHIDLVANIVIYEQTLSGSFDGASQQAVKAKNMKKYCNFTQNSKLWVQMCMFAGFFFNYAKHDPHLLMARPLVKRQNPPKQKKNRLRNPRITATACRQESLWVYCPFRILFFIGFKNKINK
jgi:hypothetical protein